MPLLHFPLARRPFDPTWQVHSLGRMDIECLFCHALHWQAEELTASSNNHHIFGMCCYQGKINLPILQPIPDDLLRLFNGEDARSLAFHKLILFYNNSQKKNYFFYFRHSFLYNTYISLSILYIYLIKYLFFYNFLLFPYSFTPLSHIPNTIKKNTKILNAQVRATTSVRSNFLYIL